MKGIFPEERLIFSFHSAPVAIGSVYAPVVKSSTTGDINEHTTQLFHPWSFRYCFGVSKQIVIPLNTQLLLKKWIMQASLDYLSLGSSTWKSLLTLPPSGMDNNGPWKSFRIVIENSSTKSMGLLRDMIVAVGTDLPEMVVHFRPNDISPKWNGMLRLSVYVR